MPQMAASIRRVWDRSAPIGPLGDEQCRLRRHALAPGLQELGIVVEAVEFHQQMLARHQPTPTRTSCRSAKC